MAQRKYTRPTVNGKQKELDSSEWVIVRNTHEAIISDEFWNTVQAVTKKNADSYGVNFRKRRTDKGDNILKGLLLCPHCQKTINRKLIQQKAIITAIIAVLCNAQTRVAQQKRLRKPK